MALRQCKQAVSHAIWCVRSPERMLAPEMGGSCTAALQAASRLDSGAHRQDGGAHISTTIMRLEDGR